MRKGFARRLRLLRESFGISQVRLAHALGIPQSYVAKWEAEAYDPSDTLKTRAASFFQVSPVWLMDGTEPVFKGIVFIPTFIHIPHGRFDAERWLATAMLAVGDGAVVDRVAVNTNNTGEAVFLFGRGNDLRLFMHFGALPGGSRGLSGIDIEGALERITRGPVTSGCEWDSSRMYRLPESTFRLISPLSTLEGIEKLLSTTIPRDLKKARCDDGPARETRLGELVGSLRDEARQEIAKRDIDNSACRFLLSIGDEDTLRGILFLVPDLMKDLGLGRDEVAGLSAADLMEKIRDYCKGSCGW
ncbi:MAG: transcriptional repressor DicA [Syntrophorhabdus sp. PtaB.Bin047]|nr:MAG: transcriptional repressor DicA [Syntrophorhabdus sp. PtaB.Bin047]